MQNINLDNENNFIDMIIIMVDKINELVDEYNRLNNVESTKRCNK